MLHNIELHSSVISYFENDVDNYVSDYLGGDMRKKLSWN